MRVFVAGATGVVGRRAVAGSSPPGTRSPGCRGSPEKDALLESLGARPVARRPLRRRRAAGRGGRARRGGERHDQDPAGRADGAHERVGRERAHPPGGVGQPRRRRDRGGRDRVRAGVARVHVRRARRRVDRRGLDAVGDVAVQRRGRGRGGERRALHARRAGAGVVLRFGRFYAPDSDQARRDDAARPARPACSTSATPTATRR